MSPKPRRPTIVGASPGTIEPPHGSPHPRITFIGYSPDDCLETEVTSVADLGAMAEAWSVAWINVDGLGNARTLEELSELFALHPLAMEDAVHTTQRPKTEDFEEHLFATSRMVTLDDDLESEQLAVFIGRGVVITIQEHPGDCLEPVRQRIRRNRPRIRGSGADYLAYAILDAVVDGYFPVLETIADGLEDLEERIGDAPSHETIHALQRTKRQLRRLRRYMWPQRELFNQLMADEHGFIQDETRVYLRDCADHALRILDLLESYREWSADLTDFALSVMSNRMNDVMRVLTTIATVFIPLTFIAGIYGMNFDPDASSLNMPELRWRWGYPAVWTVMLVTGVALLWWFRRRGWLGPDADS